MLSIPAQVLCLDKRKDLWTGLLQQLKDANIETEPFFTGDGGILDKYNKINLPRTLMGEWGYGKPEFKHRHWNAFISHHMMISRAKERGWKRFLMLEDDTYLTERFFDILEDRPELLELINDRKYDLLYLGWWKGKEDDDWNKQIEFNYDAHLTVGVDKVDRLGGLHAVVINESMYDRMLSLKPVDPMDSQLNGLHSTIDSYFVYPKIIHTHSTFSFCENSHVDRKKIQ